MKKSHSSSSRYWLRSLLPLGLAVTTLSPLLHGAELTRTGAVENASLGYNVQISGGRAATSDYAGSWWGPGAVFVYGDLDSRRGVGSETLRLLPSDGADYYGFGGSMTIADSIALVSSRDNGAGQGPGTVYVFRGVDTATGDLTAQQTLTASDSGDLNGFGGAVSLSGNMALVGASSELNMDDNRGYVYVYRNLDSGTGNRTENLKIISPAGGIEDGFGTAISLSGTTALIGADRSNGAVSREGAVYLYRGLDQDHTVTSQKLVASDAANGDYFGDAVSLSGGLGVVGASSKNNSTGSVYLFRNLDAGTPEQAAILKASDAAIHHSFGSSLAISGETALVGAKGDGGSGFSYGAAYLFLDLDAVSGNVELTESVKITMSQKGEMDNFGAAVSLDGDRFVIGAPGKKDSLGDTYGAAYTGSVSSLTTLDAGNTTKIISRISFASKTDWVVGATTDGNEVILDVGDSADVRGIGKAVYIGRDAGSDDNRLAIDGTLLAHEVYIGALAGNEGNVLELSDGAIFEDVTLRLALGNTLRLETPEGDFLDFLGTASLQVWSESAWTTVNALNYTSLITLDELGGFTEIGVLSTSVVPEPGAWALLLGSAGLMAALRRRRA